MRAFPRLLRVGLAVLPFLACDAFSGGSGGSGGDRFVVKVNVTNTSHQPVVGAAVTIGRQTELTGPGGATADVLVNAGNQTVTVAAAGYNTYSNTFDIGGAMTINVEVRGPNQVSGQVLNSQNGQGVDGAAVTFSRNGRVELTETTGASGTFSLVDAPDGTFDLAISKPGFVDFHRANVQITGGSFPIDPITLAEAPPPGAVRIVLTWGAAPRDIDSHLTGPDGAGGRFHVYYSNRSAGGATLDRDDTDGNGPETTTITTPHDGMYRFSAFNYSDPTPAGGAGIAASPTRVEVYSSTGLLKSYTAPAPTSGNTWRVFEMTMNGGTPTFNDNGGASLGYVQASGSGDTGTFLTGGGPPPPAAKRPAR